MEEPTHNGTCFSQLPTRDLQAIASGFPVEVKEGDPTLLPIIRAIAASYAIERNFSEPGALR